MTGPGQRAALGRGPGRALSMAFLLLLAGWLLPPGELLAAPLDLPIVAVTSDGNGGQTYTLSLQILLAMTALTLLPAALMMLTSFTRIIIVLGLLRQALGTAQTPSNQILLGLSLFLTLFVMSPVLDRIHDQALQPWMNEQIDSTEALSRAEVPLREFMLRQTRQADLRLFSEMSGVSEQVALPEVPFRVLVPAFVTSELKTAFQFGFVVFIPFLIIDLVVASVLMSMGMMMLSPVIISFPFKLMLFVLADGWNLIIGSLAGSYFLG